MNKLVRQAKLFFNRKSSKSYAMGLYALTQAASKIPQEEDADDRFLLDFVIVIQDCLDKLNLFVIEDEVKDLNDCFDLWANLYELQQVAEVQFQNFYMKNVGVKFSYFLSDDLGKEHPYSILMNSTAESMSLLEELLGRFANSRIKDLSK